MITNDIVNELGTNFIEYAVAVNTDRSLPNAFDGLKPVAKRILYDCLDKGFIYTKPHVKCANIVGTTMSDFHPHGDSSIYEALVRLSQDWIMRYPLISFHGNNGNRDGDGPAAPRYTEGRLAQLSEDGLLQGIKKNKVDVVPNYSETMAEPTSLPALFPNLLCNPNMGIGVAVSCNWLPHNLNEVANAIYDYLKGKEPTLLGPDFPTGGLIINKKDIPNIMKTGQGSVIVRGKYKIEGNNIVFYEIPYGIATEPLMDQIGKLAENGDIPYIEAIRNESNKKDGFRLVIECEDESYINRVIKNLFKKTNLQCSIAYNQVALINKTPTDMNLEDCIKVYVDYNNNCIIRESKYDIDKQQARLHIIEGLRKALDNIDDIILIIKSSSSANDAKTDIIKKYSFSDEQATAILEMRLSKLAKLEEKELIDEETNLHNSIDKLNQIVDNPTEELKKRLKELVKKYGDNRRTEIIDLVEEPDDEDETTIEPDNCIIITTESGYIKRIAGETYKTAKKVIKSTDDIINIITTNTADNLLIFSNKGKLYRLPALDIPEGSGKGVLIKLLASMEPDEMPSAVYSSAMDYDYIMFITQKGMIKKSKLAIYEAMKKAKGAPVISFVGADKIATTLLLKEEPIAMITKQGQFLYCETKEINPTGKTARGIKGFKVADKDTVVSAVAIRDQEEKIAIITNRGYAKRVDISEFALRSSPGGKGQIAYKPTDKTGEVADIKMVNDEDSIFIVGDNNVAIVDVKDIPIAHRTTMGSIIINDNNKVNTYKVKS